MIKILEILAFSVSVTAFFRAAVYHLRSEMPKYFQLYVCAAGCYVLEELWVIVNSLLGNGSRDGLVTVRLFGFFGCLCFMLSANVNEFDSMVDEGNDPRAGKLALAAPFLLAALYGIYAFSPFNGEPLPVVVAGFLSVCPALPASYFSLKHLLLPEDAMGFLRITRKTNLTALAFYGINCLYPLLDLTCTKSTMSVVDLAVSLLLFALMHFCRKGAGEWKALI